MKILKRRDKLDKTITVRVPDAIKAELDQLRAHADAAGFDVGGYATRVTDCHDPADRGRTGRAGTQATDPAW
jgi:hypothetical protein